MGAQSKALFLPAGRLAKPVAFEPYEPRPCVDERDSEHPPLLGGVRSVHPERLPEQAEDTSPAIEHRAARLAESNRRATEESDHNLSEDHDHFPSTFTSWNERPLISTTSCSPCLAAA